MVAAQLPDGFSRRYFERDQRVHDTARDPTSHELLPFEFAMLGLICGPAILEAFVGRKLRSLTSVNVA